jgi:tRNA nucleotidyltransferase (CCA-adding enzyme)
MKNEQVYKVGGVVRDTLLGHEVQDVDWVVVGSSIDEMLALGFTPVGKDFPVFLHPVTKQEYALARTERKIKAGYTGFAVDTKNITLNQDLERRDLTINAMAMDFQGNLIDPFNGQADLAKGILRHVSAAFAEDPLRVLRVARFAARYNFQVAPETMQLMQNMVSKGELEFLVAERVWQEIVRALTETYPQVFIEVLRSVGALKYILPEVDNLFGVPQPPAHHPEIDTGLHILLCLQQARLLSAEPEVLFAVLVHDVGKATTPKHLLPHHYGHEQRSVELIKIMANRLKIPKKYLKLALLVAGWHGHCHNIAQLKASTILKLLKAVDAFRNPHQLQQFLLACEADARGRAGLEQREYKPASICKQAFNAAQQVKIKDYHGLEGAVIAAKLHQLRVHAINLMANKL